MRAVLGADVIDALAAAARDHALQIVALHVDHPPRQPAVAVDPAAHVGRIDVPQRLRAERAGDRAAVVVGHPRGVEAEAGARRRADAAARNETENERAGGEAVAVDDDAFAGGAHRGEGLQVLADLAAAIFGDAHRGGCGRDRGPEHRGAEQQQARETHDPRPLQDRLSAVVI